MHGQHGEMEMDGTRIMRQKQSSELQFRHGSNIPHHQSFGMERKQLSLNVEYSNTITMVVVVVVVVLFSYCDYWHYRFRYR
jgi:hypothetical protein